MSIAELGRQTSWRGRWVWIALALSVTLNVFFIGGLMWVKLSMRPAIAPMERVQRLGQSLDLNDEQRVAFEHFVRVLRQRGRSARESNQPLIEQIWGELAKPVPDQAAVSKLGNEVTQNRTAFQKEVATALMGFVQTLKPEQRERLATIARSPRDEPARRFFQAITP